MGYEEYPDRIDYDTELNYLQGILDGTKTALQALDIAKTVLDTRINKAHAELKELQDKGP